MRLRVNFCCSFTPVVQDLLFGVFGYEEVVASVERVANVKDLQSGEF